MHAHDQNKDYKGPVHVYGHVRPKWQKKSRRCPGIIMQSPKRYYM